jgi:hypothetical protein
MSKLLLRARKWRSCGWHPDLVDTVHEIDLIVDFQVVRCISINRTGDRWRGQAGDATQTISWFPVKGIKYSYLQRCFYSIIICRARVFSRLRTHIMFYDRDFHRRVWYVVFWFVWSLCFLTTQSASCLEFQVSRCADLSMGCSSESHVKFLF